MLLFVLLLLLLLLFVVLRTHVNIVCVPVRMGVEAELTLRMTDSLKRRLQEEASLSSPQAQLQA